MRFECKMATRPRFGVLGFVSVVLLVVAEGRFCAQAQAQGPWDRRPSDAGQGGRGGEGRWGGWSRRGGGFGSGDRGRDSRFGRGGDRQGGPNAGPPNGAPSGADPKTAKEEDPKAKVLNYAKGVVKKHDRNGDNRLQGDERNGLRGQLAEADLNKDGTITVDELVNHLSALPPAIPPGAPAAGPNANAALKPGQRVLYGNSWGQASKNEWEGPRVYRFTAAKDRLPSDLPEQFFEKDVNGNGQVEMSEYSRTWSKSLAEEFRSFDLNDDGIITAKEFMKQSP